MTDDVLFETRGAIGLITLNRPKALNALNIPMIDAIEPRLVGWAADPGIAAVVIRGAGDRAFCAGGDLRALYEFGERAPRVAVEAPEQDFFRKEYTLNWRIHHFPKPYIALIDGITMGGGVGLSRHGSHRVATERTIVAMPETGIGLFPDVGGSWFLNRCPGHVGLYLALTGIHLKEADALHAEFATHHVASERLEALVDDLAGADWSGDPSAVADEILGRHHNDPAAAPLAEHAALIDACFGRDGVEAVLAALEAEGGAWAAETREVLAGKSPTSLKVTFEQLRRGRDMAYDDAATMEYRLSQAALASHDLFEGIRAVLVDKDRSPRWQPSTLDAVADADIARWFGPQQAPDLILR